MSIIILLNDFMKTIISIKIFKIDLNRMIFSTYNDKIYLRINKKIVKLLFYILFYVGGIID